MPILSFKHNVNPTLRLSQPYTPLVMVNCLYCCDNKTKKKYFCLFVFVSVLHPVCQVSNWVILLPVCSSSRTARKDRQKVRNGHTHANALTLILYTQTLNFFLSSTEAFQALKSMLQVDHVPSHLAVTRLVQALGSCGDVAGIQEVESLMKSLGTTLNLSSMLFINNTAMAHINT